MDEMLRMIVDKLDRMEQKLDSVEKNQERFEQKLEKFEQKLDSVEKNQEKFEQKLEKFEQKLDSVEKNQEKFEQKLDSVEKKLDRIEIKVDATFEQVAKNTEHEAVFNELAATVEDHSTDIRLLKKLVAN
ncbi:hypothetical protein [Cohnella nanjingensis]|uniref:Uncharacterized protein n=1 Tax=Cohnella nanjingensis TaxID=1387779 RepID=A0A7X0RM75_9BACL|nr:hypothetical protein [Cohnella nanjingensis]MBB6669921.1 hypothetical protein [Cohnella nanjingensis]